jgi:hypothetical protein
MQELEQDAQETREVNMIFIKEFKFFIKKFNKKQKEDYMLNVNKIVRDKFNTKFLVPNKVQAFLLNYEIKKLLDKAINIKNEKYNRIIYLNSDMTPTGIMNTLTFLSNEYYHIEFKYHIIDPKEDFDRCTFENDNIAFID